MRINIVINDQTIMEDIRLAIENLLEDNDIRFPSADAREEFEQECFDEIADTHENNSAWDSSYLPTWDMIQTKVQDAMYEHEYNTEC